ncbi:MAG: ABC transporter ATP-binding protein [Chitinophagales bacterium]
MSSVLTIRNLSKRYGHIQAVNDVSFEVERESVFGILGPNGSGKTTTLGIVLDVIKSDVGSYSWFDSERHTNDIKRRVGAILETPNFYPYLSGHKNLKIVADIKGVPYSKITTVLDKVSLLGRKDSRFKEYSLGMKQRLAIASALLSDPEVLVLDEPTNGLDPEGIRQIRDLIKQIASEGKTIILASHLLDEVEKVCTHVGILKSGNLLKYGNVNEILSEEVLLEVATDNLAALKAAIAEYPSLSLIDEVNGKLSVKSLDPALNATTLNKSLLEKGIVLNHLVSKKSSLEDQFLKIVKGK